MKRWMVAVVLVVVLVAIVAVAAFILMPRSTHITGLVYGEALSSRTYAGPKGVALTATVRCNGVAASALPDGSFDLVVPQAHRYTCTVIASSDYVSQTVTIPAAGGSNIVLNFGPRALDTCTQQAAAFDMECGPLKLRRGAVSGTVTYRGGQQPVPDATVRCADATDPSALSNEQPAWPRASTDDQGAYRLGDLLPGHYVCVAESLHGAASRQEVTVAPGGTTPASFQVCDAQCDALHFHGGAVMHTFTAYLIFWLPPSYTLEPGVADSAFEASIQRYFRQVGGTPFYDLLTQYWDYAGPVRDDVSLGGVYVDTTPYEHCASAQACTPIAADKTTPLLDTDIQAEVMRAADANPAWQTDREHEFFVFTGYTAEECDTSRADSKCTWKGQKQGYCAYHSSIDYLNPYDSKRPFVYAYIPDHANNGGQCAYSPYRLTPHGDRVLDAELSSISHEQFESVTDPIPYDGLDGPVGWYDDAKGQSDGEIADKCAMQLGTLGGDGGNTTLGNGERYLLQAEWSNRANGCAFA